MTTDDKNSPETVIRLGNISASVFANKTEGGRQIRSVSLQRSYRTESSERHYVNSFNAADLPALQRVIQLAQAHVERLDGIVDPNLE
ncbi:hypothetical protein [Lignipirellula cremea]|uniref:Uncharacterized protein n=1 Tax=Lignipirellula cremea TaxID=2528010 RepID=A0A518DYK0_9BACT|nr:hypothetical protein [Lignipirellula cremea]QDU96917.1 hypothetical protein Pla8534_47400 [Lignipirellula cremea]